MSLLLKFTVVFAVSGALISVAMGILTGNSIFSVLMSGLFCTAFSAILGLVVFKTLEVRVPEFLELFLGEELEFSEREEGEDLSSDFDTAEDEERELGGDFSAFESGGEEDHEGMGEDTKFGDHILVNDIKIKNEPKLMAEAIRTVLARDEMNED